MGQHWNCVLFLYSAIDRDMCMLPYIIDVGNDSVAIISTELSRPHRHHLILVEGKTISNVTGVIM